MATEDGVFLPKKEYLHVYGLVGEHGLQEIVLLPSTFLERIKCYGIAHASRQYEHR